VILEGLVTTLEHEGSPHLAPMGAIVDVEISQLILRPFQSSRTFANLKRSGQGVFHITDDVELLARAAIHQLDRFPSVTRASAVDGVILADACRWYAFRVLRKDDREPRARCECDVVDQGWIRDFIGFNRAKHAVVEAAVLATRVGLADRHQLLEEFTRLSVIVDKTAGEQERRAFALLKQYVRMAVEQENNHTRHCDHREPEE
jgi:hypothetical protein